MRIICKRDSGWLLLLWCAMRERDSTPAETLFKVCKIPSRVLKDTQESYLATGQSLLSAPGRVAFSARMDPGGSIVHP